MSALANKGNGEIVLTGRDAAEVIPAADLIRYKSFSQIPAFIHFADGKEIPFTGWENWMQERYFKEDKGAGFRFLRSESDQLGMNHYRYQQLQNGIPLEFGIWIVHVKDGMVVSMNGELFDEIPNLKPTVGETTALAYAMENIGADVYKWEIPAEEAHLKLEQNDPEATYFPQGELVLVNTDPSLQTLDLRLTWKFNIYAAQPMSRNEVYVDATSLSIAFNENLIHHSDSNGTAVTGYSGSQTITADYTGSTFRLRESGRGNGVETYDLNNGSNYAAATDFTDSDNYWNSTAVEIYGTDAHWGAEMTYDYFYDNYGRNSIDNNGFKLLSYAHYGNNYANAFWDGQRMTYGDGSNGNSPFTAIDIAGHEVSHGLTSFTADLVYSYESGALNESFSDIFGASVEFEALGFSNGDWLMGEDLGFVIRSMSNPNTYGDPDTYGGTNWYTGTGDNGGVHINSGVQNFWFYLMTVGGSGVNDLGNSYSVTALGLEDAGAIAFRNLTVYLTTSSQYADARFYAIQSAQDLFGVCTQEVESTTNAWYAVGVGAAYTAGVTADFQADDTEHCSVPYTINFQNFSTNADTFSWNFGDGNTSTLAAPSHTYTTAGTYTVSLNASSSCGNDAKTETSYIEVGPSVPCDYVLPYNGAGEIQEGCNGYLYDNGGAAGDYYANTDSWVTISPCGASSVTLTFEEFQLEGGTSCPYDYLEIYDGTDMNATLLGSYCGSNTPPATITSSGPAITVRMYADGGLQFSGFKIKWDCEEGSTLPIPAFEASAFETCTGLVSFSNGSSNCPDGYLWRFGDGTTSTDFEPTHEYTTNGTFDVTLVVSNANGTDSVVQQSLITVDRPSAPAGPDVDICPNESATLLALPTATGTTQWYDSPTATTPIHVGDTFVTPVLQSSTPYYVESLVEGGSTSVGPADNTFGGGNNFNFYQYLIFDVYQAVTLKTVKVYAEGAADRTIELRDANGSVIQAATVAIPDGESVVTLNFDLPVGTDLQLGTSAGTAINLFRNNENVAYPYEINGVLSITNSSANQNGGLDHYYFFYDWVVGDPDCTSPKTTIYASMAECTGIDEIGGSLVDIYPNPNRGAFFINWNGTTVETVEVYNAQGSMVLKPTRITKDMQLELAKGVYFVKISGSNVLTTKRVIVQ